MAKTSPTKIRLLAIERMLSSGRRLKVDEIQVELKQKYDIIAGREAIFDDIYAINRFIPIESRPGPGGGFKRIDVFARCRDD